MPDTDDDFSEVEWFGRPQDEPRLHAEAAKARLKFRQEHPPENCWIDSVQTIELFIGGVVRAKVAPDDAQISYLDDRGGVQSTAIYLGSESPFDVVEAHLGIGPVTEIRDESLEAEEVISAWPRERAEQDAQEFRHRYGDREDEIFHYLRSAVGTLRLAAKGRGAAFDLSPLLEAITSAALDRYETTLVQVQAAAEALENSERGIWLGAAALADCRRAIVAIERHIAIQQQRPSRRPSALAGTAGVKTPAAPVPAP